MDELLKLAVIVALCPAPSVLVFFLIYRRRLSKQAEDRGPFQQIRRRAPGESLRVQLEDGDEAINAWLIFLAVCPAVVGLSVGLIKMPGLVLPIAALSGAAIWSAFCAWKLYALYRKRTELEVGFDGRRCVAEELNRLIAEGYEVFHDVPFESFNIDHVLLGPAGLFAIETKTASSRAYQEERVEFDGFRLNWPGHGEIYGLEHATTQAQALGQWITEALGETVEAIPILTVPGVPLECTATSKTVLVLTSREIGKLGDVKIVAMKEELIRRICHHLNQRCSPGG